RPRTGLQKFAVVEPGLGHGSPSVSGPAPVPTPFLPCRSALIPSRTLMHGSPWLRASEATRVRRRQINGLERLGRAIGVLIDGLKCGRRKIGVLELAAIGSTQPSWASIGVNGMHDFPHDPTEVLNRAADIFRMAGHMFGEGLLLCRGLVVSLLDDDPQAWPR